MAKIVVTGAGGFIGSNMLKFLKEKGHYIRAVDKSFKPERAKMYKYADEVVGLDLRDMKSCLLALNEMDYVIHFAANMGGVGFFSKHDYHPYMDNMTMDMNILQACELLKIERLYYSSSACIYPVNMQMREGDAPKLEENQLNYSADADQMYGWEKLMMTKLCERSPLDARVGIHHTIFGEYQEIEGERVKAPTAIATKAIRAKSALQEAKQPYFPIWGNGKQIRTFMYIEDCLEKVYEVLMAKEYHGAVNIGTEEEVSVTDVAKICCEILDINVDFTYESHKPSGVLARGCSNKKYDMYYKYRNKFTTQQGFERLIKWLQNP
jgi:GDP-D-mannose 3',5'-epimerase